MTRTNINENELSHKKNSALALNIRSNQCSASV